MCHDARVGRHSVRAAHPGVLIAVLAAAGISVSLTQTLMIPLIPELPMLLHTSPANASWTITVTLLTAAVATPVFGRLGDMYGPKPMLMICAATLTVGSLIAAIDQFTGAVHHRPRAAGSGHADHSAGHQCAALGRYRPTGSARQWD